VGGNVSKAVDKCPTCTATCKMAVRHSDTAKGIMVSLVFHVVAVVLVAFSDFIVSGSSSPKEDDGKDRTQSGEGALDINGSDLVGVVVVALVALVLSSLDDPMG